ncbi:hypothetical protein SPI_02875 [Niveomyces insectorum RCEF 264]|uniref:Uncharacterized protein n=1 Tax=Niveomyces insectorum RCEF 264 TaxID=1081102 RepID=A0A167WVF2_9HYPO|nr:hypothetical protein SPI_02875 [Niveomyces insectorum RCEF 264]
MSSSGPSRAEQKERRRAKKEAKIDAAAEANRKRRRESEALLKAILRKVVGTDHKLAFASLGLEDDLHGTVAVDAFGYHTHLANIVVHTAELRYAAETNRFQTLCLAATVELCRYLKKSDWSKIEHDPDLYDLALRIFASPYFTTLGRWGFYYETLLKLKPALAKKFLVGQEVAMLTCGDGFDQVVHNVKTLHAPREQTDQVQAEPDEARTLPGHWASPSSGTVVGSTPESQSVAPRPLPVPAQPDSQHSQQHGPYFSQTPAVGHQSSAESSDARITKRTRLEGIIHPSFHPSRRNKQSKANSYPEHNLLPPINAAVLPPLNAQHIPVRTAETMEHPLGFAFPPRASIPQGPQFPRPFDHPHSGQQHLNPQPEILPRISAFTPGFHRPPGDGFGHGNAPAQARSQAQRSNANSLPRYFLTQGRQADIQRYFEGTGMILEAINRTIFRSRGQITNALRAGIYGNDATIVVDLGPIDRTLLHEAEIRTLKEKWQASSVEVQECVQIYLYDVPGSLVSSAFSVLDDI